MQNIFPNTDPLYICVEKKGPKYLDLARVSAKGTCPEKTVLCNPAAAFENRYCATQIEMCPINNLKFVTARDPKDKESSFY